jgi:hypothetical protein
MVKRIGFAPHRWMLKHAKTIVSRCFQQSSPEIDPMKRVYQWKVHKKSNQHMTSFQKIEGKS